MEKPMYLYETVVEIEDGISLKITTAGPLFAEEEINEYMFSIHKHAQNDISYYTTTLVGVYEEQSKYFKLAHRAMKYVETYN